MTVRLEMGEVTVGITAPRSFSKLERRHSVPGRIRAALYRLQNGKCDACGRQMVKCCKATRERGDALMCTIEHVVPRSQLSLGEHTIVVATCLGCNSKRGTRDYETFRAQRRGAFA